MYVYKSVAESRVTNAHHVTNSALTGSRSPAGPRRCPEALCVLWGRPIRNASCFAVCAVVCDPLSRAECVPPFACESERGPFVREVENRNMLIGLTQQDTRFRCLSQLILAVPAIESGVKLIHTNHIL